MIHEIGHTKFTFFYIFGWKCSIYCIKSFLPLGQVPIPYLLCVCFSYTFSRNFTRDYFMHSSKTAPRNLLIEDLSCAGSSARGSSRNSTTPMIPVWDLSRNSPMGLNMDFSKNFFMYLLRNSKRMFFSRFSKVSSRVLSMDFSRLINIFHPF